MLRNSKKIPYGRRSLSASCQDDQILEDYYVKCILIKSSLYISRSTRYTASAGEQGKRANDHFLYIRRNTLRLCGDDSDSKLCYENKSFASEERLKCEASSSCSFDEKSVVKDDRKRIFMSFLYFSRFLALSFFLVVKDI